MIFNHQYLHLCASIFLIIFISSSTATSFCSSLTSSADKNTPCFLEPPVHNPVYIRTSGNSLVLPCHVARTKQATVEWWYQDFDRSIDAKIYPVFPAVRPTVVRFMTSVSPSSQNANETDIIDVSILLRHVNVDDKGIYRCVLRSWGSNRFRDMEDNSRERNEQLPALVYNVHLTGPRLCQQSLSPLPCFTGMLTSSPTIIDAYQTTFLQCVVRTSPRPVTIFWVAGNASENSVLITDFLKTNEYNGDRLNRLFPLSTFDYSLELTVNPDVSERVYSCVIDGATDAETTLFTYIVRSIKTNSENNSEENITTETNETTSVTVTESQTEKSSNQTDNIISHDALTSEEVDQLRKKNAHEHTDKKQKKTKENDEDDDAKPEPHARKNKSRRR